MSDKKIEGIVRRVNVDRSCFILEGSDIVYNFGDSVDEFLEKGDKVVVHYCKNTIPNCSSIDNITVGKLIF